ncbi:dihydroxyacetone kinase subunit DhaL [Enterococcus pingfangensis]|uniref:dihydroxyacetone kinase subunit DhaL n=1 Tax=Enterococcus pingfangensis TaxID=2559924 RepID=UPI0010F74C64|nr:dihydroxyacetone kinase subunit DhaL [Enterococcus pingfangensis]
MTNNIVINKEFMVNSLKEMAKLSEEQRDYWTSLDSDIGDGDHGINLSIGFRGISKELDNISDNTTDINSLLKKAGMILLSKVGGASGPLYGSFFIKMGAKYPDEEEISYSDFLVMIMDGIKAVQSRGKAEIGDKTMIDAFIPGYEVLENYQVDDDPYKNFAQFIMKMKEGSDSTIPLVAKKGRAMRLGERAIGHRDPGSESSWMLMDIFHKELLKRRDGNE